MQLKRTCTCLHCVHVPYRTVLLSISTVIKTVDRNIKMEELKEVQKSSSTPFPWKGSKTNEENDDGDEANVITSTKTTTMEPPTAKKLKNSTTAKIRATRLEQNRKAAKESRRRKKIMIEDLQRSVIFFSRANGKVKQQNDDLSRLLMHAQAQVSAIESSSTQIEQHEKAKDRDLKQMHEGINRKHDILSESSYQAANFSINTDTTTCKQSATPTTSTNTNDILASSSNFSVMQPGATMAAMANFQNAAAVAMNAAVQGMQQIPGVVSLNSSASHQHTTPAAAVPTNSSRNIHANNVSAQQAYNDTMTAIAMQQVAAAAAAAAVSTTTGTTQYLPQFQLQQQQQHTPTHQLPQQPQSVTLKATTTPSPKISTADINNGTT